MSPPVLTSPAAQYRQQKKRQSIGGQRKPASIEEEPRDGAGSTKCDDDSESSVRVVVRKRPASEHEVDCVRCEAPLVLAMEPKKKVDLTSYTHIHKFCFDDSFDSFDTTGALYERSMGGLINNFWRGGTSTCFCFGQTASGKTHTLFGSCGGSGVGDAHPDSAGMYILAARDIFYRLKEGRGGGILSDEHQLEPGWHLRIDVSMYEIYGQKVRDLLQIDSRKKR